MNNGQSRSNMDSFELSGYLSKNCPTLDSVHQQNLSSWLQNYDVKSSASSNVPSYSLPYQRWYRFKEAFSPLMVVESITKLGFWPKTCLDCFGGSGTTSLTCQFLGITPSTIEVNPFLADLIEAKLQTYDTKLLLEDYCEVIERSQSTSVDLRSIRGSSWPKTLVEPGVNGRWIFGRETFRKILALRNAIERIGDKRNQRLLRVLLGSTLIELSNVHISGKGRRYRKSWQDSQKTPEDVSAAFVRSFNDAFGDIAGYGRRAVQGYSIARGDARLLVGQQKPIDIALFSPPYPNSFDYTDIYNIELWVLGYLESSADNKSLRTSTLRSHVQVSRDLTWNQVNSPLLKTTVKSLHRASEQLWDKSIPDMVGSYFADMEEVLKGIRKIINPKGAVMMTVGNSRYADTLIDVGAIIREMASSMGYECTAIDGIRSMRTSPQQGGRLELSEDLITLRPI